MNILGILFCLFVVLPYLEIVAFTVLGGAIGIFPTLFLILFTGMVGAAMAKQGGIESWQRIQRTMREGKDPSKEMINGLLLLVAGIALIIPGFITDIIGLLLLLPFVRELVIEHLAKRWHVSSIVTPPRQEESNDDPEIIDVNAKETKSTYEEIDL